MNTNIKVLEEEFSSLIEASTKTYELIKTDKKSESLDDYYKVKNEVDKINELLDGHMKETLTYYLKKHNIFSKINYILKEQYKVDSSQLSLSYSKNKKEKTCDIEYKGESFQVIQPSLRECLNVLLEESHFMYPLLYVFYSNKEKKCHFQEAIIINMLSKKIND